MEICLNMCGGKKHQNIKSEETWRVEQWDWTDPYCGILEATVTLNQALLIFLSKCFCHSVILWYRLWTKEKTEKKGFLCRFIQKKYPKT